MSATTQEIAQQNLDELFYEFNLDLRAALYDTIDENRREAVYQDNVIRPDLQANIKELGEILQHARTSGARQVIQDTLVAGIQHFNRKRHDNRLRVKELAAEQAVNKAMLAEVNRAISGYEDFCDYEDTMTTITMYLD